MVEELVPQLERFKQNITTATIDEDPEETNRRKGLTAYVHLLIILSIPNGHHSTFKKIEEISERLLAKSAITRLMDKGKDSKVAASLIERLRQAIVCYQVGGYCASVLGIVDKGSRYHNSKQSTIKSLISQ